MKSKNIFYSFKYALTGIFESFKEERNMKIHFLMMIIATVLGFVYHISNMEWIACLICFGLVISAELMNSAIESVTNIASPIISEKARFAKDAAAGGVLVMAIISFLVGAIIFLPKIF